MQTECRTDQLEFEGLKGRRVVAAFDGGAMTSDAGALLLRHTARVVGLFSRVAACFSDNRSALLREHEVCTLVGQRICGIALGYEDVNDHDELRHDPVFSLLSEKLQPGRADCALLAGKSTLNRLEHAPQSAAALSRYHKIDHDGAALERLFVDLYLDAHPRPPKRIILDLDATDDPLHGDQEGKFYHDYYKCHCYLPLYIFAGRHLLAAKLRPANIDGAAGAKEEVERIVEQIRERWPRTNIVLRADSGFTRNELMNWCEANDVDYLFGLARNKRLVSRIAGELAAAKSEHQETGKPARRFADFMWETRKSWSRPRRVVGKGEHLKKGSNPRFVVTTLSTNEIDARALYEDLYCARGEMENRIKECQLDLFADRTSTRSMASNQLRLWFASFAYLLLENLRRLGLAGTSLAKATCGTIRLKLLKLAATVKTSVRRIKIALPSAAPYRAEFAKAHERISIAA
jgi:hypothetical protein